MHVNVNCLKGQMMLMSVSWRVKPGQDRTTAMWQLKIATILVLASLVSGTDLANQAIDDARQALVDTAAQFALEPNETAIRNSPAQLFAKIRRAPTTEAAAEALAAQLFEDGYLQLVAGEGGADSNSDILDEVRELFRLSGCEEMTMCESCTGEFHKRFRTADGTCNNLGNPTWGAAIRPFNRLLPAEYENGVNEPKGWTPGTQYNGFELPSARKVSLDVIKAVAILEDPTYSQMLMQFGQFLDHDLTFTPMVSLTGDSGEVSCDGVCHNVFPCFPVIPPENDPRIPPGSCISSTRSSGSCVESIPFIREQFNAITAFIDASNVYGSDLDRQQRLREQEPDIGDLKRGILSEAGKPFLPFNLEDDECIPNPDGEDVPCFDAGDERSNEQPALAAMHTIWMREHNRIAAKLRTLNPGSDGESIFQAARKIVGAENQVITYKHWLPKIIGQAGMDAIGPYENYDPAADPTTFNEFSTAAFRFGHGLIRPFVHRLKDDLTPIDKGNLQLHLGFFAPHVVVNDGGIDPYLRGMFGIPLKLQDPNNIVTDELTERLFALAEAVALDLASLNIQRGRDHGLQGYNAYRESCKLKRAATFADFAPEIPNNIIDKLEAVYSHPDNVDLWAGAMAETPAPGARVGPTFQCILVQQFRALRDGDRFWYENPDVFSFAQKAELEKTSLSRVLCDNGDNINRIQPDAFLSAELDEMGPCSDLDEVNLDLWKDVDDKGFCTCTNLDFTGPGGCRP